MGNKISLMGIFQNIMVEKLPVSLIKFAVINHWQGEGNHANRGPHSFARQDESRRHFAADAIELAAGGFTDNVSFFVNVVFPTAGLIGSRPSRIPSSLDELPLIVTDAAT